MLCLGQASGLSLLRGACKRLEKPVQQEVMGTGQAGRVLLSLLDLTGGDQYLETFLARDDFTWTLCILHWFPFPSKSSRLFAVFMFHRVAMDTEPFVAPGEMRVGVCEHFHQLINI